MIIATMIAPIIITILITAQKGAGMKEISDQNTNMSDALTMNGRAVLVQTAAGIFYGILEKADTRNRTALLKNAYMLPKSGYTLQNLKSQMEDTRFAKLSELDALPIPTITDLAAHGPYIFAINHAFAGTSNLSQVSLLSLTEVLVIVPVDDPALFEKPEFQGAARITG
jgi:hypothetical protein